MKTVLKNRINSNNTKLTNTTYTAGTNMTSISNNTYCASLTCGNINTSYLSTLTSNVQTQLNNAVSGSSVLTTLTGNSNGNYFIPFLKTSSATSNTLYIDNTTTPLIYNPSVGRLSTTELTIGSNNLAPGMNSSLLYQSHPRNHKKNEGSVKFVNNLLEYEFSDRE